MPSVSRRVLSSPPHSSTPMNESLAPHTTTTTCGHVSSTQTRRALYMHTTPCLILPSLPPFFLLPSLHLSLIPGLPLMADRSKLSTSCHLLKLPSPLPPSQHTDKKQANRKRLCHPSHVGVHASASRKKGDDGPSPYSLTLPSPFPPQVAPQPNHPHTGTPNVLFLFL